MLANRTPIKNIYKKKRKEKKRKNGYYLYVMEFIWNFNAGRIVSLSIVGAPSGSLGW